MLVSSEHVHDKICHLLLWKKIEAAVLFAGHFSLK
jgi:hypothetical protein